MPATRQMTNLSMISSSAKVRSTSSTTDILSRGIASTRSSVLRPVESSAIWLQVKASCASLLGLELSSCKRVTRWPWLCTLPRIVERDVEMTILLRYSDCNAVYWVWRDGLERVASMQIQLM
jgi:hypothetical protein